MKYAAAYRDLFYFTFGGTPNISQRPQVVISHPKDISLYGTLCYTHTEVRIMAESKLREMSMEFAVTVIRACEQIKGHRSLVNQLERSATSIGANIYEANYAHSRADFISKLQIALKECYETEYWIQLFHRAELLSEQESRMIYNQCGTIRRILISSINTAKQNSK